MRSKSLPPVDASLEPIVLERYFELGGWIGMQHHGMSDGFHHETTLGEELEHVVVREGARVLGLVVDELLLALDPQLEVGLREVVCGHRNILLDGCGVARSYAQRCPICA